VKFPSWNPPQKLAWQAVDGSKRRTLTMAWGRGVAKSCFLRQCAWIWIAQHDGRLRTDALEPCRGVRIVFLTPTLQQFKDVHAAQIESELGSKWSSLGGKIDHTSWRITFPGGSWIAPMPAAEFTAQREAFEPTSSWLTRPTTSTSLSLAHGGIRYFNPSLTCQLSDGGMQ